MQTKRYEVDACLCSSLSGVIFVILKPRKMTIKVLSRYQPHLIISLFLNYFIDGVLPKLKNIVIPFTKNFMV